MTDDGLARVAARHQTIALIETAAGVMSMAVIAATPGIIRPGLGTIHLALDLGIVVDALFDPIPPPDVSGVAR